MTTDSELQTLQEKVKRLTHDRDIAMRMAEHSDKVAKELKNEVENYRRLWQHAEARKIYDPLSLKVTYTYPSEKLPVVDWFRKIFRG
jgi:histidine ammonia-lyase